MLQLLTALCRYLGKLPVAVVQGWDRFFFSPADPLLLGLIRIMVGSILLYIHVSSSAFVLDFIGPEGWIDEEVYAELHDVVKHPKYQLQTTKQTQAEKDLIDLKHKGMVPYGFSIWFWIRDPLWIKITYYAGIVCIALFTLGVFTRFTAVISWAFHLSYLHRSMMIWFGMDAMLSFMMLYLSIGPSGAALSVDRWLRCRRTGNWNAPEPGWLANVALRLMQIHISIVYFIAGIAKLQGATWWDGTATWLTMNAPLFNESLDIGWLVSPDRGEWFWYYFTFASTYFTLAFELSFPFLIWNRYLRPWMIFAAIMLHVGIGLFMGLGGFGMVMLSGCFSFIPQDGLRWAYNILTRKPLEPRGTVRNLPYEFPKQ
ncbi:MAG: HTTM domain-containing protein [Gemmatales bacterium]